LDLRNKLLRLLVRISVRLLDNDHTIKVDHRSSIANVDKTGGQQYNSPHHSGQDGGSDRSCEFSADRSDCEPEGSVCLYSRF